MFFYLKYQILWFWKKSRLPKGCCFKYMYQALSVEYLKIWYECAFVVLSVCVFMCVDGNFVCLWVCTWVCQCVWVLIYFCFYVHLCMCVIVGMLSCICEWLCTYVWVFFVKCAFKVNSFLLDHFTLISVFFRTQTRYFLNLSRILK